MIELHFKNFLKKQIIQQSKSALMRVNSQQQTEFSTRCLAPLVKGMFFQKPKTKGEASVPLLSSNIFVVLKLKWQRLTNGAKIREMHKRTIAGYVQVCDLTPTVETSEGDNKNMEYFTFDKAWLFIWDSYYWETPRSCLSRPGGISLRGECVGRENRPSCWF